MDIKKAIAVCLISLFSATLVVLIARTLDNQAAGRIEPQLAQIVEELKAIRKSGQFHPALDNKADREPLSDCLMVYYFHGNTRCPTCVSIETQSHATIFADYESRLKSGELAWKILNYEDSSNAALAKKFEISMPVVVLAKINGGQIENWNRLDRVWALVGDKTAFAKYIHEEIEKMLIAVKQPIQENAKTDESSIPVPETDTSNLPIPAPQSASPEIPVPESTK